MEYRASRAGSPVTVVDEENGVEIRSIAVTSVGRVRGNNEDSVHLWSFDNFTLGLVADGMGGAAGGEEASRIAVETIQDEFVKMLPDVDAWRSISEEEIAERLQHALSKANQNVLEKAASNHELHGMGTTATMVLLNGIRAIFAHIGDSRAYIIEEEERAINQITHDHSFVEALVLSGHLTKEEAERHPMRNVLYRALGQKPDAELDVDIYTHDLQDGDRLVLCSDGLPRHVKDEEICLTALLSDDPRIIAQKLIDTANERGGEDNVSAVVITIRHQT